MSNIFEKSEKKNANFDRLRNYLVDFSEEKLGSKLRTLTFPLKMSSKSEKPFDTSDFLGGSEIEEFAHELHTSNPGTNSRQNKK
jgi:hypothetical protein